LKAYFAEFTNEDPVVLYLHTYLYLDAEPHNIYRIQSRIHEFVVKEKLNEDTLPKVEILPDELLEVEMPKLYKAVDALVLPSRGEGWGLPLMEGSSKQVDKI